jgi:anti-anti-sigma regulatory factor
MGQPKVRITIEESGEATRLTLEGRVAGPWAAELDRVWAESLPRLQNQSVSVDISNVIYADDDGIRVLQAIYAQARPEILSNTPWTRHLAEQMAAKPYELPEEEQGDASND